MISNESFWITMFKVECENYSKRYTICTHILAGWLGCRTGRGTLRRASRGSCEWFADRRWPLSWRIGHTQWLTAVHWWPWRAQRPTSRPASSNRRLVCIARVRPPRNRRRTGRWTRARTRRRKQWWRQPRLSVFGGRKRGRRPPQPRRTALWPRFAGRPPTRSAARRPLTSRSWALVATPAAGR